MTRQLTTEGIARGAALIGCEVAAIKAVIAVETAGSGFIADGRPKILFERHHFHRRTKGQFDAKWPDLSNPVAGGYTKGEEWNRFYRALQLEPVAAQESCSWGLGQIMGWNWALTGEKSLTGFIHANYHNEDSQLALMVGFIQNAGLSDELRRKDWAGFARGYNGAGYARNKYDARLKAAYIAAGGK